MKHLASVILLLFLTGFFLSIHPVKAADLLPNMDAQIKNVEVPNPALIGNAISIDVTVKNYACGIIGADLVVILKNGDVEIARYSAYVFRYFAQVKTFNFKYSIAGPARVEQLTVELYWNNLGKLTLKDTEQLKINIVDKIRPEPSPVPAKTATLIPSSTSTPTFTPTPRATFLPTPLLVPTSTHTASPQHTTLYPTPFFHSPTSVSNATQLPNVTLTPTPVISPSISNTTSTSTLTSTPTPEPTQTPAPISPTQAPLIPPFSTFIHNQTAAVAPTLTPTATSIQTSTPTLVIPTTTPHKSTPHSQLSPTALSISTSTPTPSLIPSELPFSSVPANTPSLIQQLSLHSDTYAVIAIVIMLTIAIGLWLTRKRNPQTSIDQFFKAPPT